MNSTEATERAHRNTEQAARANASVPMRGACVCERMYELPPNAETGAPRVAARTEKRQINNIVVML